MPFKCDVHGWMNAYVGVLDHPYFAVTDKDGKFDLKTLPPGTYTIEAWHEKLGTQAAEGHDRREGDEGHRLHLQGAAETERRATNRREGRDRQEGREGRPVRPRSARPASPAAEMLHRFATFVAACTVLLVLAGSLVTSTGSGLSVPDWPTTYGWNLFTFPPSKWVGGILYEHGHRLIASGVGFLTIVLAAWLWLKEPRRWMRWLGVAALGDRRRARRARRPDGALLPAGGCFDRARGPCRNLLLPHDRDRARSRRRGGSRMTDAPGTSSDPMLPRARDHRRPF